MLRYADQGADVTLYRAIRDGEEYEGCRRWAETNSDGVHVEDGLGQITEANCLLSDWFAQPLLPFAASPVHQTSTYE